MTYVAALDVGGTRIKAALVGADGSLQHTLTAPTPATVNRHLGRTVAELLERLTQQSAHPAQAIGVTVPGVVDESRNLGIRSANLHWRDLDLHHPIHEATGLPTAIGHDVRAGLVAESWIGAARHHPDVLFMPIGTGISAALRVDGHELVAGGYAGEIGHTVVDPDGPECPCGARGCLEAHSSARAIAHRYATRAGIDPATVDAYTVAAKVEAEDPLACEIWAEAVDHLARVLALTANACGIPVAVVGGGLANAGDTLFKPLRTRAAAHGSALRPLQIVPARLGDLAGCLGAGRLAWRLLEKT
ncbi:glucokinase [Austwickia chelonae]|uniref:Glucokinase n=1 Tax=Austwickia chelonae NBRC 105200 TaxID=1184607 RepID=K6W7Z6_9MICO|nr:ROK family protein [Austwickia chelonae]GAB77962.1 hypothetical protein AUCHE_08_02050 [Austwickia chelonae NBRC 105200]SEV93162.1 glucokinase [Austwickia chelonae]